MTVLTHDNFQELYKNVKKYQITNSELVARYYYLRRDEEPDRELLKDIQTLQKSSKIFYLTELRECLLRCRNESMELLVYIEWFENKLNDFEENMLRKYYFRRGLQPDKEFAKRKEYIYNPM